MKKGVQPEDMVTVDVFLNDADRPIRMPSSQLGRFEVAWRDQGKSVTIYAHEDERAGARMGGPRFREMVDPPPEPPLHEELALLGLAEPD